MQRVLEFWCEDQTYVIMLQGQIDKYVPSGGTSDCEEDRTREVGLGDGRVFLYVGWLGVASEEVAFWWSP